jgi:hypothetical protein
MSYHKSVQGVGWVSLVPSGTYPDPVHLAEIEAMDLNITEEDGDLEDSNGDIIDSFTVKRVIEGTVTLKDISGSLLAATTRGVTVAAGTKQGYAQTSTIPTTPFQITVTNGATFADDLGVIDLTSGKAMTCAATATGTNVYSVTAAGVYTFNTADAGHSVLINYRATQAAVGTTSTIASATAAQAYYGLHCYQVIAGKPWGIYVPAARLPGLSAKFGKGGWSDTTIKFKATKDASNNFVHIYLPE